MSKLDLLKSTIAQRLGDDYDEEEAAKELYDSYLSEPKNFAPGHVQAYLKNYLSRPKIGEVMKILEDNDFFWKEQIIDPNLYLNEQTGLLNSEMAYANIPSTKTEPAEKILYRCLIIASLLEQEPGILSPKLQEFRRDFDKEILVAELSKLRSALNAENRMTTKITDYFNQLAKNDPANKQKPSNILSAMKIELIPIDIEDLERLVEKAKCAQTDINGKKIYFFIGDTGSGKTTTIKALAGYKMGKVKFKNISSISIVEPIEPGSKILEMHSNPLSKSVTRYPIAIRPRQHMTKKEIYLTDTPGWGDTEGVEVQIANSIGVRNAIETASRFTAVILISKDSWGNRGNGLRNVARTVSSIFQDYGDIKDSVAIVLNRFEKEQFNELAPRLEDLIEQLNNSDKADDNLVAFLTHMKEAAKDKELLTFNPLEDNPIEFMSILTRFPDKKPKNVFRNSSPSGNLIKNYCAEVFKRIRYYLQNDSADMVRYFLKGMEKLNEILAGEINKEVEESKSEIENFIRNKYDKIVTEFNSQARAYALTVEDVVIYFTEIDKLPASPESELRKSFTWRSKGESNFSDELKRLANSLMEPKGVNEDRDRKILQILKLLKSDRLPKKQQEKVSELQSEVAKWLIKRIEQATKFYEEAINGDKYKDAAQFFEAAARYVKYRPLLESKQLEDSEDSDFDRINGILGDFVKKLTKEGRGFLRGRSCGNIAKLAEIDQRLDKLRNCSKLMSQNEEVADKVKSEINEFIRDMKKFSDDKMSDISKILKNDKEKLIDNSMVESFKEGQIWLQELKKVESVRHSIEYHEETISNLLSTYFRSQEDQLANNKGASSKDPKELMKNFEIIQNTIKRISAIAQYGGEDIVAEANKLKENVLTELQDVTPRLVESFSVNARQISSNSPSCEESLQKIKEGKEIEGVMMRLDTFKSECHKLKEKNDRNAVLLNDALENTGKYLECLNTNKDKDKEFNEYREVDTLQLYLKLNLPNIEMALKFIEFVSQEPMYGENQTKARGQFDKATELIKYCVDTLAEVLRTFTNKIQESPKANISQSIQRDLVGNSYRERWNLTRRVYQFITKLETNCPTIRRLSQVDCMTLKSEFAHDIETLYNDFEREKQQNSQNFNQLSLLQKKCDIFKEKDWEVIGKQQLQEFTQLREKISESIATSQRITMDRVDRLLSGKRFRDLKNHMESLKSQEGQEEGQTYKTAMDKIQNYAIEYIREKKQALRLLMGEDFDTSKLLEYDEMETELSEFFAVSNDQAVKKMLDEFGLKMSKMVEKIEGNVEDQINQDQLSEAMKTMQQLETIQKNLSPENQLPAKAKFTNAINQKLSNLEKEIQSPHPEFRKLFHFFKINECRSEKERKLIDLRRLWETKLLDNCTQYKQRLEKVTLRQELEALKKETDEFFKYFSEENRAEKKEEIRRIYENCANKLLRKEQEVRQGILKIKSNSKLDLNSMAPWLEYLMKENNSTLTSEVVSTILTVWEQRQRQQREERKHFIVQYIKMYRGEIHKFIEDAKPYERLISQACIDLKHNFKVFFDSELDKLRAELKPVLIEKKHKKDMQLQKTQKDREVLINAIKQLVESIREANGDQSTKFLLESLEKTYWVTTGEIVTVFEKAVNMINIKAMFEGNRRSDLMCAFEVLERIGGVIEEIKNTNPSSFFSKKLLIDLNLLARLKQLPNYEDLLRDFKKKMKEYQTFASSFNITNNKYDNADEKQLDEVLKQFKTSIENTKNYADIYQFLEDIKLKTDDAERKLERDMGSVFEESQRAVSRLNEEHEDNILRKLNRNSLILSCYERAFKLENQYGKKIQQAIEENIRNDSLKCEVLIDNSKGLLDETKKNSESLKAREKEQIKQSLEQINQELEMKRNSIKADLESQINASDEESKKESLRKEMSTEISSAENDCNNKKSESIDQIKQKYKKEFELSEQSPKDLLNAVAREVSRIKQIELGLVLGKEECQRSLNKCMEKVKKNGTRYANRLAMQLEELGDSYAMIILNQNEKLFSSYTMTKYNDSIANKGPEYVIQNVKMNSGKEDQNLSEYDSKAIMQKYEEFKNHYDKLTLDYANSQEVSYIGKLKDIIRSKAHDVAKGYESGNCKQGHLLLAEVFAFWAIKKANTTEDGVEFLYKPHPAQIIAIFLILGICGDRQQKLDNRIAQVLTGEGKSLVLGGLSCYLGLIGFEVFCMCYSRLLSRRDYEDFVELFRDLNIDDHILYGTFGEVTQKLLNSNNRDLRTDIKEIMVNNKDCSDGFFSNIKNAVKGMVKKNREKILLVDEVDVFFAKEFFGRYYTPSTSITHECIENLATFVWQNRIDITVTQLKSSPEFQVCLKELPKLEKILEYNAIDMVNSVKNFKHSYVLQNGRIGYVLPEGISFKANYGWKTIFAYFYEADRGTIKVRPQDFVSISLVCCEMSYAELPREFKHIMGVTGTLKILPDCQKTVLRDWYRIGNFYYIPSVYGASQRTKMGARVVEKSIFFAQICKAIEAQTSKNRPVLVFFTTVDMVNDFNLSQEFTKLKENANTLTEKNNEDATKGRIIRATRKKNITVLTRAFGRGIDFAVHEKEVKELGGLHVIQTFISEEESEAVQIEGRSGRQGTRGSCEILIEEDELKKIELEPTQTQGTPEEIEKIINSKRNMISERTYTEQIQEAEKCKTNHQVGKEILSNIRSGNNEEVRSAVSNLNKIEVIPASSGQIIKTVIGIDATASMERALKQVISNTNTCLERAYFVLKEKGITNGFEIQMVIYRNYNSEASKLIQCSPFSNNANDLISFLQTIEVDGGWKNEAIENLYNHVLNYETDVAQLIVIGDAAGNTNEEISLKRKNRGQNYWQKDPRFADPLDGDKLIRELADREIPVHSFYIGSGPAKYFSEVSNLTGGSCSEYKYGAPDAAETLTSFIVENILRKIGEQCGQDLVREYRSIRFN